MLGVWRRLSTHFPVSTIQVREREREEWVSEAGSGLQGGRGLPSIKPSPSSSFVLSTAVLGSSHLTPYQRRMSWDGYIDVLLKPNNDGVVLLEKAAICGIECQSCWAKSDGFNITTEEIKKLASKDSSVFQSSGVYLGGTKFMLVKYDFDDDNYPLLQLRSRPDENNVTVSATVGKSKKAFVIGIGKKDIAAGMVSERVFATTKYLKDSSY